MKIDIQNLKFNYNSEKIIDDLSLNIYPGEVLAILGPSGCGKSTLLELIIGLLKPRSGQIIYKDINKERNRFSVLIRESKLFPWKTLGENLDIIDTKLDIDKLLEELKIIGYKDYYPRALSVGMNQRALILRTILYDAQVWIFDEPFNGLDNVTKSITQKMLLDNKDDRTIIFVTHNLDEVVDFADRAIIWDPTVCRPDILLERQGNWLEVLKANLPKSIINQVKYND